MPHLIVEHSENLAARADLPALLQALHRCALDSGVFPVGGLRTRAEPRAHYVIADGHPDNAFVHVTVRLGHGRSAEVRRATAERLFAVLCDQLDTAFRDSPLGISLEMQEIDPALSFKQNNLHARVEQRRAATGSTA